MTLRGTIKRIIEVSGYTVSRLATDVGNPDAEEPGVYDRDGLRSIHNHDFMLDPEFLRAYDRGIVAGEADYEWQWRVHVGLWAAYTASKLDGDFVECGVNRGFLSSAIMEYLNWDSLNKTFYLMDTFCGIDERYVSDEEIAHGVLKLKESGFYTENEEAARENFSQWQNVEFVVGAIPETLPAVQTDRVAYLHIDMNNPQPEVAAFEYFWERLVPGAIVLYDDYAYRGYELQKAAMDAAVAVVGLKVLSLPTGQGLLVVPS